jgi:hypothetical protein
VAPERWFMTLLVWVSRCGESPSGALTEGRPRCMTSRCWCRRCHGSPWFCQRATTSEIAKQLGAVSVPQDLGAQAGVHDSAALIPSIFWVWTTTRRSSSRRPCFEDFECGDRVGVDGWSQQGRLSRTCAGWRWRPQPAPQGPPGGLPQVHGSACPFDGGPAGLLSGQ